MGKKSEVFAAPVVGHRQKRAADCSMCKFPLTSDLGGSLGIPCIHS